MLGSGQSARLLKCLLLGLLLSLGLSCLFACQPSPPPLDVHSLSAEVHRLTNLLRAEHGAEPLERLEVLDGLSLRHSSNMASQGFFEHADPEGHTPADRMRLFLSDLVSRNSGENIAQRSLEARSNTEFAEVLIQMWRDSPGHFRNMISKDFKHLGVGVVKTEDRIYATQTFASGVALLSTSLPEAVRAGEEVTLEFDFLGDFPQAELNAFLETPDPQARIPAGNGSFYIGKGPLRPDWLSDRRFRLRVRADYGLGTYQLRLGQKGQYLDHRFSFKVASALM